MSHVVLLAFAFLTAPSPALSAEVVSPAPLDTVLARHLRAGKMDYLGLAADPGPLRRYLAAAARAEPERFPRREQMAFWINAYNATVLDGVIRRPGLKSVLDPEQRGGDSAGFFREPRTLAGRALALDDVEQRVLRPYGDPRIHFVLNCASLGCPALPARALRAATLESVMDTATRSFLGDPSRNRRGADGALELSSIFQWYRQDFEGAPGGLAGFVARYWPREPRPAPGTAIRFLPYDWSLNGRWR